MNEKGGLNVTDDYEKFIGPRLPPRNDPVVRDGLYLRIEYGVR
jgi:hypothetical protein